MCHQQSWDRSDLHPQEPLPEKTTETVWGKPQHISLCLEHRQITYLKSMETYV